MKLKKRIYIPIIILVIVGLLYGVFYHTHRGQVLAMYAFAGFSAPWSLKIDCAKVTDVRVDEKFDRPLKFSQEAINGLRRFWHFSYYRECLFNAGYDFEGNEIKASDITMNEDGSYQYTNYFAGTTFTVPNNTIIIADNATDPDMEDRRLTSMLRSGDAVIDVLTYRSLNEIDSFARLTTDFVRFSSSTGEMVSQKVIRNENSVPIYYVYQDDGLQGFVTFSNRDQVIAVFGNEEALPLLGLASSTISFTELSEE